MKQMPAVLSEIHIAQSLKEPIFSRSFFSSSCFRKKL